jgi:predicted RNase H-like nuclease
VLQVTGPVLGIDGCPGGWIGALVETGRVAWLIQREVGPLLVADADVVGIDMPIGLPDDGPRECDVLARRKLAPRGSTVFPAPVRAVIGAQTYQEACARSRSARRDATAISLQTWHILSKITQVDAVMTAALEDRVIEVHPESSFARMAGASLPPKKRADGRAARFAALATWLPDPWSAVATRPPGARSDDALDALAASWSAARFAQGVAEVLPPGELPRDRLGRAMRIVL